MKIGIPCESAEGERRVSATPDTVQRLKKRGFEVYIASNAGVNASFSDQAYKKAGAEIGENQSVWADSDLILKVTPPTLDEIELMPEGGRLMSFLWPAENEELVQKLKERKITSIAMDCVPRISRAQKLDALSSMSNISGYRAVIEAAYHYSSFFSAQFTAAGRVDQATVLIVGAGVAGLAAIGAARGLGAKVLAFDVRSAAREQIESLGAEFVEVELTESGEGAGGYAKVMSDEFIKAEMALFKDLASKVDIVITTALIPGRPAPKLWLKEAVEEMKPGSVIVDIAAERGGNCELTQPNKCVEHNGVQIVGWTDMPSRLASTSSQLYGMNLVHYLKDIGSDPGEVHFDLEDVVVRSSIVTHQGDLLYPPPPLHELDPNSLPKEMQNKASDSKEEAPVKSVPKAPTPKAAAPKASAAKVKKSTKKKSGHGHGASNEPPEPISPVTQGILVFAAIIWLALLVGIDGPQAKLTVDPTLNFLNHLTVFALSCFIGWQVVWNVTPALHTPLMSVTNAISGIILVGGMLQAHGMDLHSYSILGAAAVFLAMINVMGGFMVTQRMLAMFRK
jgi:NAD(P) transhydrogenase subunit alpha